MPLRGKMGKKRKFVDVFKTTKCSACALLQNENCPQCSGSNSMAQEPAIAQPAKRSLLHQILRHGLNVQTKTSNTASVAVAQAQNPPSQKFNGLFQHFKISRFKDGLNYIKGKEIEPFLTSVPAPEVPTSATKETFTDSKISLTSNTDTDTIIEDDLKSLNDSNLSEHELKNTMEESLPSCDTFLPLKPLFFEVPTSQADPIFIGRNWLFTDIERILFNPQGNHDKNRGIIITGDGGTGKTSILLQLVENSCFGRRSGQMAAQNGGGALLSLASKLVAYHFCQDKMYSEICHTTGFGRQMAEENFMIRHAVPGLTGFTVDYRISCLVPEFVHSIAAQLCQAPQLICYRDFLAENPVVQNSLSKLNCLINPSEAFTKGVLDPLNYLQQCGKIPATSSLLLVIDSISEAEVHKAETEDTISSFLAQHVQKCPSWLKIILTSRSGQQLPLIPFQEIPLSGDLHSRDLIDYIRFRVKRCPGIKRNVSGSSSGAGLERFKRHLHKISQGNFLFAKLSLDFIEQGSIQIKSSNFKVLPRTLAELFLLECNLRFPIPEEFRKLEPILSTCLTALNPLNLLEIYHSINSLHSSENIPWENFTESIQSLSSILTPRSDGTFMFFHSTFREWIIRPGESLEPMRKHQFQCDTRMGHAAISFRLSRIEAPLTPDKTLELGHHILKAHIYKGLQQSRDHSVASKDLQAFWLACSSENLSQTLVHPSSVYSTNFKVTRLLLIAGASPNQTTDLYRSAPILAVAAAEGKLNLVSILLEFGADVDTVNLDGDAALHLACEHGHLDTVKLLLKNGASPDQLNHESQCPFTKAVLQSHDVVVNHLIESMDEPSAAIRRALVAICLHQVAGPQLDLLDNLMKEFHAYLDSPDGMCGETPLTAAVRAGRDDVVNIILSRGGNPGAPNLNGTPPLNLAAKEGHRAIVKTLLMAGCSLETTDSHKRTPLMEAVIEAQFEVVDLLVSEGADLMAEDDEGMNALSWTSLRGYSEIAQHLLANGMDADHSDKLGRTPLDLASHSGSEEIAQILLDHGALLERTDLQGVRPLDRAVSCGHLGLVRFFLRSGAKINLTTWNMAAGNRETILVLLNKFLDDGLGLCKSGRLREGVHRFQYALRRIPIGGQQGSLRTDDTKQETFRELRVNILLQLSRAKRNLKEPVEAVNLASESIKLDPNSYKTWFERAKAYYCLRAISESIRDCSRAIELAAGNNEIQRRLLGFKKSIIRDQRLSSYQFSTNSLKFTKSTLTIESETLKPKASTSNCLSARKIRLA